MAKKLLGNIAHLNDVNLSISGGQGGTSFLISGNFHNETSIYPDSRSTNKENFHYSLNHLSTDGKFNISLSGIVDATQINLPSGANSLGGFAYSIVPNFPAYDSLGKLNWMRSQNPYGVLNQTYSSNTLTLTSNLLLRYNILPGLDAKASLGYTLVQTSDDNVQPLSAFNPNPNSGAFSHHIVDLFRNTTINFEPQLTYNTHVSKGRFDIVAGSTIMKTVGQMPFYLDAYNFPSDVYINNLVLAGKSLVSNSYTAYHYLSLFSRASYNWDDRYILSGTFRRDGSDRFGADHRFGNFGAIGGAWIFSNESFWNNLPFLSFGKLRGSIGWVGSDNVDNYSYLSYYTGITTGTYNGGAGVTPGHLSNANFGWESTSKIDAAVELGFFKDRLLVTTSYFRNRTFNQIVQYPVSGQTGFGSYTANLKAAVVQNKGWEVELTSINIKNNNFRWNTSFNITLPNNKLLKYDNVEQSPFSDRLIVGETINGIYKYHYTGIDPATNLPTYQDGNNDGYPTSTATYLATPALAIYGQGDLYYVGSRDPKYYGGLTNTISYKGIQLDFTFQYTVGAKKESYLSTVSQPGRFVGITGNLPEKALEQIKSWGLGKAFISSNFVPQYAFFITSSDKLIQDASFVRMTNAALSYNFTGKVVKSLHASALRAYIQAQNLFVISKYDGFDPESGASAVPPLLRINFGIQYSF